VKVRFSPVFLIAVPLACLILVVAGRLLYDFPPVHERLAWRVDNWRAQIKYALNPPEQAVFLPQAQVEQAVQETMQAYQPTATPTLTPTSSPTLPGPTPTATTSPTPAPTDTSVPGQVRLSGVKYEDQHNRWNYCGPANLSMALTFWGWDGNRDVVGAYVKPEDKDKNVMPYEMADFVNTQTSGLKALVRSGGDIDLIRRMVAAGFPVLTEKGYYEYDYNGKLGWMGHYQYVTGYDDAKGVLIVQDTYRDGPNHEVPYTDFTDGWRSFNNVFLIVYPQEREADVLALLGSYADTDWAYRHALETAQSEAQTLDGVDQFFAWFNVGSSHVGLREYQDAASAYDEAFRLYAGMSEDEMRPYRMMWYQTGPYWAYYYSGRYQDVLSLADTTLNDTILEPVLEESLYWRGMAEAALGDTSGAISDFRDSLRWHPGFAASLEQLQQMGVSP
jgi:tetratricopeptide (TPR) repeat protein